MTMGNQRLSPFTLRQFTLGQFKFAQLKHKLVLLFSFLVLTGCAANIDKVHRVSLEGKLGYILQPIPSHLMNTGIQALFKVKQKETENQFLMQVEMSPSHLLISGMTLEGLSLFTLDWNIALDTLTFDKKIAIEPLRILAELQFVLWPIEAIAKGLDRGNIALIKEGYRRIDDEGDAIYQIQTKGNMSHLTNLKQNYTIEIKELDRWSLEDTFNSLNSVDVNSTELIATKKLEH